MWRYGFDTPTNVNDHETNCGGFGRQWDRNKGKIETQAGINLNNMNLHKVCVVYVVMPMI